jgi:homoserine dehydrogenase
MDAPLAVPVTASHVPGALRVGIAGLGTVGAGVVSLLRRMPALVAARAGRPIELVSVSARNRELDRGMSLEGLAGMATRCASRPTPRWTSSWRRWAARRARRVPW